MSLGHQDKEIGQHVYRVYQLPFGQARPLLTVLLRMIGPTLAGALHGGEGLQKLLDGEVNFPRAIHELCLSMNDADLATLIDALAKVSWLVNPPQDVAATGQGSNAGCAYLGLGIDDGRYMLMDEWWPPRYQEFLGWLGFAVQVNFASFLGGKLNVGAALSGLRRAATSSPSPSPKGSTGASGDSSPATG